MKTFMEQKIQMFEKQDAERAENSRLISLAVNAGLITWADVKDRKQYGNVIAAMELVNTI